MDPLSTDSISAAALTSGVVPPCSFNVSLFHSKRKRACACALAPVFPNATVTAALTLILLAYARSGFAFRSLSFRECTRIPESPDLALPCPTPWIQYRSQTGLFLARE